MYVDFAELKAKTSFSDVVKMLGLQLKQAGGQLRGPCPACKSGGDRALVVTEGKGYFCFGNKKGGDQIALVAHILDLSVKDAAREIINRSGTRTGTSKVPERTSQTVPESEAAKETQKFQPLAYLEPEHEAVSAVGFDTGFAKENGIGYAPKGILRGTVAIPFRDEQGNLLGYIGATELKLPPTFMGKNIVAPEFGKKSA